MVPKSASLKGLERSTPRTVAPRICPVGSTAVMTPPEDLSDYTAPGSLVMRALQAAAGLGPRRPRRTSGFMKGLPGGLYGDQGCRLSESPRGSDHRADRDRQAVGA